MSRGYGKYRRGNCHNASFSFEKLLKENSNKPSAVRSAGTIGKWGITSFTSIRTMNGVQTVTSTTPSSKPQPSTEVDTTPKPKKFFKSRNTDPPDLTPAIYNEKAELTYSNTSKKFKTSYDEKSPKQSKKFFSSKNNSVKTVLGSNVNNSKKEETKPPIVLRICHGKSQLVNDSDESESSPTPSSTPSTSTATSPRNIQRSPNARITRSARRSMQQDPSCSPAMADTPGEFSLFTSPKKDVELSPQYIPAEKYEEERKAMYASLLGSAVTLDPDQQDNCSIDLKPMETKESVNEENNGEFEERGFQEKDEGEEREEEEEGGEEPMEIENDTVENMENSFQQSTRLPEPVDTSTLNEAQRTAESLVVEAKAAEFMQQHNKQSIEEEWSTDSDSDSQSTVPEFREESKSPVAPTSTNIEDHKEEILEKILEKPSLENPGPVKLLISKKKGSIFKSRSLIPDGTKKRRALYKHKWSDNDQSEKKQEVGNDNKTPVEDIEDEFGFKDDPIVRISKDTIEEDPVSSLKCSKSDKGYYTVVRNVKKAHQMQEIGEFQEFNDDVDYILDALQDNNPISTRCLSAISLATKCMAPAFRMHVRAHGTVAKFFKALHDATKDQSLGLCTATVMFVLSQDRLNMDLDRDCLELMLNLLESDVSYQQALDVCGLSSQQLEKNKQKVREICGEIQSQGHAMHLNLDNITVGQLAMETLLSLTSKRAGEWFKEELRELGGLEHIMKTICECCRQVSDYVVSWTDMLLDKLRKVDRCMRVLENVTHNNEENQLYLLKYNNGIILDTLVKLYRLCDSEIPLYPVTDISDKESAGAVIREALLVTLKVLINLTHHFNKDAQGSMLVGQRPGIIDASLHLLLQAPHYIPDQKKFELGVLVLMLLINLIQDNNWNKKLLIEARAPADHESKLPCDKSAVEALIVQFYQWEECARFAERRTDAILDGEKDGEAPLQHKSNEEFIEETVAKLLQKAGTHMEFTFLASYVVMLIGFLIMENKQYEIVVRQFLKDQNFNTMVEILKKFFNFMNLTASTEASSVSAMKTTEKVIKYLEECDMPQTASHQ